jgi:phenylalanyl-tRNA synthetase alpha chain
VSADTEHIYKEAIAAIEQADADGLRAAEVEYLGRKGKLTQLLRTLGELEPASRAATGRRLNEVKAELETAIVSRRAMLGNSTDSAGWVDMTEPPREVYQHGIRDR